MSAQPWGWRSTGSQPATHWIRQVLSKTPDRFDFNVNRCRYAEFFKQIGAPELGFLLVCSADFHMAEGFGADVRLTRTQTIMQGASHCDFRYSRKG